MRDRVIDLVLALVCAALVVEILSLAAATNSAGL